MECTRAPRRLAARLNRPLPLDQYPETTGRQSRSTLSIFPERLLRQCDPLVR
jgi:hypothetical protein